MQRSSKNGETSLARYDIIVKTFWGLPSCFLVWIENFSSQHQTSTTFSELVREDGSTLLLPRSPARFLTSTPKPRAEGSSPSAPAKNREASTMLASLFFVSAHKDSATRHGCALRSACRGVSERQWRSAANQPSRQPRQVLLPLPKNRRKHWVFAGFLFSCVAYLCGSFWFGFLVYLPVHTCRTPLQHPKRTRLRLFSPEIGCVSLFLSSFDPQNFPHLFCSLC